MSNKYYEEFISKSEKLYNKKYDYSLVNYKNARTKVKIICPIHGIFEQTPDNHLRNHSCAKCNGGVILSELDFINQSKKKHGNKYDYSILKFNGYKNNVKIICPIHGVFEQKPMYHLKHGCKLCGLDLIKYKKTLSYNKFVENANAIHNEKYDYSNTIYTGHRNKINITCKTHGVFIQKANSHLTGAGCPYCKESYGENKIRNFLEKNKINFVAQKRFKECKDIRTLPFDFYLPKYKLCIEYDGIQHFENTYRSKLFEVQHHDFIKTKFCDGKESRPNLLRISYKEYEFIEYKLNEYLLLRND